MTVSLKEELACSSCVLANGEIHVKNESKKVRIEKRIWNELASTGEKLMAIEHELVR